jgi:pimeloyl-ACP methyl ester carboxylesterase
VLSGSADFDERAAYERAARLFRRAYYPVGALRQAAATLAAPDRSAQLADLRVPTLVIHGTADPLVPYENGLRVHRAIPGSKMLALVGVGHDLPATAAERVLDTLIKHLSA